MAKHTQTIRQLLSTNCLSVFDHFVGLALKGLNDILQKQTAFTGKTSSEISLCSKFRFEGFQHVPFQLFITHLRPMSPFTLPKNIGRPLVFCYQKGSGRGGEV